MSLLKPPQPAPTWAHAAEDILKLTKEAIDRKRAVEDKVAGLPDNECSFQSLALAHSEAAFGDVTDPLSFYHHVSADKAIRDASNEADGLMRDFGVESSMRIDVFGKKLAAQRNIAKAGLSLTTEETRLVEKMVLDGRRAGLALPEEARTELAVLNKELAQVCLEFRKNCNEGAGSISFTLEELKGVPDDYVNDFTKREEGGKEVYDVLLKSTEIYPVIQNADNPETRRRAQESFGCRLPQNVPLLERALELRRKIAALLGYPTWADYVTEVKMVKNASNAEAFLNDLEQKLRPLGAKERDALLALKAADHAENNSAQPFDGEYYHWDHSYYSRKYLMKTLELDGERLKQFFPVPFVVPKILEIYQTLLSVKFEEVKGASTWHPDVQTFAVWEADATDESGFLGYCYMDVHPRPDKYGGNAMWSVLRGYERPSGERAFPVAAMVGNLAKQNPERPALMSHFNTTLFFHEMGHVFHELLSRTRFARFHGTAGPTDFAEAPSQMLENWCREPAILAKMSSHYETKEPLPADLIEKVVQSRFVNIGMFQLQQVFMAQFDLKVHMATEAVDTTALWNDMHESITRLKQGKPCPGQAAFSHIMNGYDVGYYGYLYSLVYAEDMYHTVFKQDPLDPKLGWHYRNSVLLPGASRDEEDTLKEFLGRPPNAEAFTKLLFGRAAGTTTDL
ncbi:metallopeptidase MepB [Auriscalpium vulgare]|uniref:Metallopeptidase MepB n=1 Tax=Auriscalpium vulgare TaxID=40419 RepID=A0ACB8S2X5_9AGAM|nr:metallopeptidase MepB [Auriscalpium vulgare]